MHQFRFCRWRYPIVWPSVSCTSPSGVVLPIFWRAREDRKRVASSTISVTTVTLDWLAESLPQPTLLKIDVEGMEHLALAGGAKVLAAKPVILAEVADANRVAVCQCLQGYRFLMTNMEPATGVPRNLIAIPA